MIAAAFTAAFVALLVGGGPVARPLDRRRSTAVRLADVGSGAFGLLRRPRQGPALHLVVELLARELRSGVSLEQGVRRVTADGGALLGLGDVVDRIDRGGSLGAELDRWSVAAGDDAGLVGAVLALGLETGAATAGALDRVADTLRARSELADELRALTAQTRASAVLLAVAPLVFAVVVAVADPSVAGVLTGTPLGWACLVGGLLLDAAGFGWMRRLTGRVLS